MNIGLYELILIALITFGGAYIQSVTGFGFGIFAMIFLPRLLIYTEANVLSSLLSSLTSVSVAIAMRQKINFKNLIFPIIGCIFATYLSVQFIKTQKNETLSLMLGIVLFALSLYFFFFSDKIKIKPTWYAGLIAGLLSGILGGMFSIGGPPVVIYFMQSEKDTDSYMATISAYFVFSGAVSISIKILAGFATANVWICALIGLAALLIGSFIGKKTRDKTNPKMIKKAVYGFMALSGVMNVITALI